MEKRSVLEQLNQNLDELCTFITENASLVNCHLTDFIIDGHFQKLVSHSIRHQLLNLDPDELKLLASRRPNVNFCQLYPELSEFLLRCQSLKLENLMKNSSVFHPSPEVLFQESQNAKHIGKVSMKDHMTDKELFNDRAII